MRKKFYPSALLFLFLLFVPLVAQEEIESAQNTQNAEAKVRKPQKIITLQNNIVVIFCSYLNFLLVPSAG